MRHEVDVGRAVRAWLLSDGWEVHSEVVAFRGGPRADIVARMGRVLWVVECKTSLGFAVLDQAVRWFGQANMVSVAVPRARLCTARSCLEHLGVGLILTYYSVLQPVRPALRRRVSGRLADALCDETRAHDSPGEQHGDYHTPFRRTCRAIRDVLQTKPGLTTRELIDQVDHHYACDATARSALYKWVVSGKVPGVRVEGRPARWYAGAGP